MMGSKYSNEQRDKALGLVAGGMSATAAAKEMKIPKSTVCEWVQRATDNDEDFLAVCAQKRRARIKRQQAIADQSLIAAQRIVIAAAEDAKAIEDGLKVLKKAARDGVIGLDEDDVKAMKKVLKTSTSVGLRDLVDTAKKMDEMEASLRYATGRDDIPNAEAQEFVNATRPDLHQVQTLFSEDDAQHEETAQKK